jgi:predicted DNA-binding transcriptional regulator AlpA
MSDLQIIRIPARPFFPQRYPIPAVESLLIDPRTVARLLSVSLRTLHTMRRSSRLPLRTFRMARYVRFDRKEVERWIAAGCPGAARWHAVNTRSRR